ASAARALHREEADPRAGLALVCHGGRQGPALRRRMLPADDRCLEPLRRRPDGSHLFGPGRERHYRSGTEGLSCDRENVANRRQWPGDPIDSISRMTPWRTGVPLSYVLNFVGVRARAQSTSSSFLSRRVSGIAWTCPTPGARRPFSPTE